MDAIFAHATMYGDRFRRYTLDGEPTDEVRALLARGDTHEAFAEDLQESLSNDVRDALCGGSTPLALDLANWGLPMETLCALADALAEKTCQVVSLNLAGNPMFPETAEAVADCIARCKCLQFLSLAACDLHNQVLRPTWWSCNATLTAFECIFVTGLANNRSLLAVDLDNNSLGTEAAEGLAYALAKNPVLRVVSLRSNLLMDTGLAKLAQVARLADHDGFLNKLPPATNVSNPATVDVGELFQDEDRKGRTSLLDIRSFGKPVFGALAQEAIVENNRKQLDAEVANFFRLDELKAQ